MLLPNALVSLRCWFLMKYLHNLTKSLTDQYVVLKVSLTFQPFARSTVVTAIKYAVSESPQIVDTLLSQRMPRVLSLLGDAEPVPITF